MLADDGETNLTENFGFKPAGPGHMKKKAAPMLIRAAREEGLSSSRINPETG
jgi:hypothetical protein